MVLYPYLFAEEDNLPFPLLQQPKIQLNPSCMQKKTIICWNFFSRKYGKAFSPPLTELVITLKEIIIEQIRSRVQLEFKWTEILNLNKPLITFFFTYSCVQKNFITFSLISVFPPEFLMKFQNVIIQQKILNQSMQFCNTENKNTFMYL